MSIIERFPNEISTEIISYLAQNDLASASRVSHGWHAISQPLLYKEPYLITEGEQPSCLYFFLRTLLTPGRESLANHVHTLVLGWSIFESELQEEPESDLALFKNAASRLQLDEPLASDGAQVVLLMHLLPCLRILDVIPPEDRDEFNDLMEAHYATQHTGSLPLAFRFLREFVSSSDFADCGVGSTMLLTLLRLPHIRTIVVPMVDEDESPFPGADSTAIVAISTVTNLNFSYTDLSPSALTRIFTVPRTLTHFSYCAAQGWDYDLAAFSTALQPLQHSLRHLHLDLYRYNKDASQPITTLASLRDWPLLRGERISLLPLLGTTGSQELARVLPAGLCALEIISDPSWLAERVVDEVVVMLGEKERLLPRLKMLAVLLSGEKSLEDMERLGAACKVANVQLVIDPAQRIVG